MNDTIFCLLKFGKQKYLKNLIDQGEIYFNSPKNFSESVIPEQGDKYEGSRWVQQIKEPIRVKLEHPTIGVFNFKTCGNSELIEYNDNFLSYSLFAFTNKCFNNSSTFSIDNKILDCEDYTHCIVIKTPNQFLVSIQNVLNKSHIQYEGNLCEYKNIQKTGFHKTGVFVKDYNDFSNQKEFRITIAAKGNEKCKKIYIGNLSEYCVLVDAESFVKESVWKANKCDRV